jgi:hypothetical protein
MSHLSVTPDAVKLSGEGVHLVLVNLDGLIDATSYL